MAQGQAVQELAVLFADIGGSTLLYQRVGDAAAHSMVTACLGTIRQAVEGAQGTLLRTVGDAVLATFSTCDEAYLGALEIQRSQRDAALAVRVGFHWGSVIPDGGDVYGHAVNVAARVASLANTFEIITTEAVVERLSPIHRGRAALLDRIGVRGIATPLAVYSMRWHEEDTMQATQLFTQIQPVTARAQERELVLTHANAEVTLRAHGDTCTIGRDGNNTFVSTAIRASRHHAIIECRHGMFVVEDTSTNGTFVVPAGQPFTHLHRDTMTLVGDGMVGAGFLPEENTGEVVRFRLRTMG